MRLTRMIEFWGWMLVGLAIVEAPFLLIAWWLAEKRALEGFFLSLFITVFFAGFLLASTRKIAQKTRLFLARSRILPDNFYLLSDLGIFCRIAVISFGQFIFFSQAIFESVSGLTTSGSSVIHSWQEIPRSLVLWRVMLEWIGGCAIIVVMISFLHAPPVTKTPLPVVNRREESGWAKKTYRKTHYFSSYDQSLYSYDFLRLAAPIFIGAPIFAAIILFAVGLPGFDAILLSISALSTGGFAQYALSQPHFAPQYSWLVAVLSLLGACGFPLWLAISVCVCQPMSCERKAMSLFFCFWP